MFGSGSTCGLTAAPRKSQQDQSDACHQPRLLPQLELQNRMLSVRLPSQFERRVQHSLGEPQDGASSAALPPDTSLLTVLMYREGTPTYGWRQRFGGKVKRHAWRNQRWDSFTLVTSNFQMRMPGAEYSGNDPYGFMSLAEVVEYFDNYVERFRLPVENRIRCFRGGNLEGILDDYSHEAMLFTLQGCWEAEAKSKRCSRIGKLHAEAKSPS
jgi:hypothetical protein